jgi:hypothetical protein
MPCTPVPIGVAARSNPRPSSATVKVRAPPFWLMTTRACWARAYFATFCSASSTQK